MLQWLPFFAHHSVCPFSSSLENMSAPGSEGAARYGGDVLSAGSPDRFGYEWHNYPELRSEYEEQFRDWTAHSDVPRRRLRHGPQLLLANGLRCRGLPRARC